MSRFHTKQSGITLIEVAVAISIITVILVVVGFSVNTYVDARSQLLNSAKAVYLAEEGYEMLRMLRDEDWNTLSALDTGDTYYFSVSTTTVAITSTPELIDGEFYREFVLDDAYRDSDDDLTDSSTAGATVDDETRMVTVSVGGVNGTTTMKAVLTNIHAI